MKAEQQSESHGESPVAFRSGFEPVDPKLDDPAFLRKTQAKIGADVDKEQHLYVNTPAMKILRKALESLEPAGSSVPDFDGVTLSPAKTESVIRHLQNRTLGGNSGLWPAFRLLVKQLRQAEMAQPHAITIVRAEPGIAEERTRKAEIEEAFHRLVARISDNRAIPKETAQKYLDSAPFLKRAGELTRDLRPYLRSASPEDVLNELLTYLIHGELDKIHLTTSEATVAWQRFRDLISRQYGEEAREALDEYARSRNFAYYPSDRSSAGPARREVAGEGVRGQAEDDESDEGPTLYRPASEEPGSRSTRRPGVTLGSGLGGIHEPLTQLYQKDIVPTAKNVSRGFRGALDDLKKIFAPQTRGPLAGKVADLIRNIGSELDQRRDRVVAAHGRLRQHFYRDTPREHGAYRLDVTRK